MEDFIKSTGMLFELAEFMHTFSEKEDVKKLKDGTDIKKRAKTLKIPVPEFLSSATITNDRHEEPETPQPVVRVFLEHDPKQHHGDPVDLRKWCVRICIWWGVCFKVCWVCPEDSFFRGCYLDVRRAN